MQIAELTGLDQALVERIQHDVPLVPRPWQAIAADIGATEAQVLDAVVRLRREQVIRQVSAIFDTRRLGYASSLVAARIDPARIEDAARVVSAHPGVSHNYQRDHAYNLWFTIAVAPDSALGLEASVDLLTDLAGAESALLLPALRVFRIGVNFDIRGDRPADARRDAPASGPTPPPARMRDVHEDPRDVAAILALQRDLPAVPEPFELLAHEHKLAPDELLERGIALREERVMRRFAAVLHHRRAGFRANGMGVWVVPPNRVEELGTTMATFEGVSHCYARPTYDDWPYGLFTMTHGRTREECEAVLAAIARETGLDDYGVLYSNREFKKVRVRYFTPEHAAWEQAQLGARA